MLRARALHIRKREHAMWVQARIMDTVADHIASGYLIELKGLTASAILCQEISGFTVQKICDEDLSESNEILKCVSVKLSNATQEIVNKYSCFRCQTLEQKQVKSIVAEVYEM